MTGARDTVAVRLENPVARFEDARSMDLSPSMMLYVTDAAADLVRIFDVAVTRTETSDVGVRVASSQPGEIGGSGSDPGFFLEPASVDASSSLFVNVADAGNGRIQRFTVDGALVEVLPVPLGAASAVDADPRFRAEDPAVGARSTGARPVAVDTSPADELLVIEQETGEVLMTDSRRRTWTRLGSSDSRPVDPVDIEILGARIYVADAADRRLHVYDRLGTRLMSERVAGRGPMALVPTPGGPAVLSGSILVGADITGEEPTSRAIRFVTGEIVMDVRMVDNALLVLTNRSLFVVPQSVWFR
ncbi:MAG: hypothetical protein HKN17_04735 [Rhodothermales bacterium]|nr:hypothetical protein [Rhodothermales bacterium]